MNKKNAADWIIYAVILVVLGAPVVGLLYLGTMRAADVYFKTGWMVAHWNDAKAFPAGSNVCMHHFCTRTDTKLKHVGGRRGYTSEVEYYYCPVHEPGFVDTGGQFDGFLYFCYWVVAIICSVILPCLLLSLFLLPIYFLGKKKLEDRFIQPLVFLVMAVDCVVWVMFAWW